MTGDSKGKTCMITGANSGIGRAAALELARMGYSVVMACRSKERGEAAMKEIRGESGSRAVDLMIADLSSMQSVRQLARDFIDKYPDLHVLVNNAGIVNMRRHLTVDGYESTFATNYLAPFLLTNLLLDRLKSSAPSRIVNVSSASHYRGHVDFDDLQGSRRYGGMRAYSQSKLALVLFTRELAKRLAGSGVTANCLHPGAVATNMWKRQAGPAGFIMKIPAAFLATPSKGAETVVYLASSPEVERSSGGYYDKKKVKKPSEESYDDTVAKRLWEVSLTLTGLGSNGTWRT